ncbi:type III secretion system export apparatus subunit SctV [Pseudothauera rhizosphaerae]|uniref:EscV/YscV/HrcV family type III secretion system export apparatus protein n=1 Tax=Pseudothauera rhizosphaerae TaxID=2565932 RepID=A0A4S4AG77_9RHOO|nr:type III secretion system export apparatus subunit SctV [Pseudothauera rhizosphaerae]THF57288.1 EscV/YscV/HrcV family type III secretion system export apparatus protein [Pseudothauera rhizosphaerae]
MNALNQKLTRWIMMAANRTDIVLAVIVVAVIFMMVLPLPTTLVDVLIGVNMCLSAVLLMVSMYIPSPLSFSAFPTVLLITTLFRLGLSIATTRLILLQADAGHIIETFGNFVVGGNLVVGLVVFLILTIVQFVVITKGAERVAEVGARFSLDAMPGKQMSIDGDMRAGVIDMDEARRRRGIVEKESQLYGAMDGAMKFVKGDAIAGLIIVAVNILGGVMIGTMQRGMTAGDALQKYSILTVGDGLISQIPALFISICAGMIVTRVSDDDGTPSNIGRDIGRQVLSQPRAFMIAAVVMLGFALVPGMPTAVFITLFFIVGTVGFVLHRSATQPAMALAGAGGGEDFNEVPAMAAAGQAKPQRPSSEPGNEFAPTVPLLMDVAAGLSASFKADVLNDELLKIRRALYFDLGVPFPGINLRFNDHLPPGSYAIMLHEVPVSQGQLRPGWLFVRESEDTLKALGVEFEKDKKFLPNLPTIWAPEKLRSLLAQAGTSVMEPTQVLTYHLAFVLKKYAADFVGIQETKFLLSAMEDRFPDLVKEVQRVMAIQKIAEILQRLVSEDVSIRNLRTILEALIDWGQKEKDSVLLTEYIRAALKRHLSYKYSAGQNLLPAFLFAPNVEDTIRGAIRQTSAGSYLALDPNVSRRLLDSIKRTVGDISAAAQRPVLLTSMDIRRYVRKMIEQDLYDLPVISYQELTQEINIQPLARIELA